MQFTFNASSTAVATGSATTSAWVELTRRATAGRHDMLLLLSHMRSYSSLLAHLLGSSPEVDGYGETLLRYRSRLDLLRLRHRIRRATGQPLRGRWLLDKVLHNHVRAPDRWLPPDRVRALIFVRQPVPTLLSMLTLARAQSDRHFDNHPQRCCDYYVSRLHRLREDAERLGESALVFDAEMLVTRPQALLSQVSGWLGLEQPLSPVYSIGRRTGEVGFGDPSVNIRSGRVLQRSASTVREDWVLPNAVLDEAQAAYSRCRTALRAHCHSLQPVTEPSALPQFTRPGKQPAPAGR
jgi:hypothetical protein